MFTEFIDFHNPKHFSKPLFKNSQPNYSALLRYARLLKFEDIKIKMDPEHNLLAIIAINNTKPGPAIGGCRYYHYDSFSIALKDALRLSYMMTIKAAMQNLPHGGAKAVILQPRLQHDRENFFKAYGNFVHEQKGIYITAQDVGTTIEDMQNINKSTPYVIGGSTTENQDPAIYTAYGVLMGIKAAVKYKLNKNNLKKVHIAVQGLGHVGSVLCQLLHEEGCKLTIFDLDKIKTETIAKKFSADSAKCAEDIYSINCDVFAPCALGGVINAVSAHMIQAPIIAGSANNQLSHHLLARYLRKLGKLYVPDFFLNSGGLIYASCLYHNISKQKAYKMIEKIYDISLELFQKADDHNQATTYIAEKIALQRLEKLSEKSN